MTKWTYYEWLGGPLLKDHRGTFRKNEGSLVEAYDDLAQEWTKVPAGILLDRLEDGALDIERISESRANELTRIAVPRR